jgi:putative membrane protein
MSEGDQDKAGLGPPPPETPADSRLRLGLETTLLAWIRTGLALMGFGFVVARFGLFLQEWIQINHVGSAKQIGLSLWFGVALIGLGVAVNVIAAVMHYPFLLRFRRGEDDLPATWRLGLVLAGALALVGVVMAGFLMLLNS